MGSLRNLVLTLFFFGITRKVKSELAKHICLRLALRCGGEDGYFIMATTLDVLRENQGLMKPGVPILLDDIGGDPDGKQLIYSDVAMWKAILQVKDATQNRARNNDLKWARRQPKVLTSNALTFDEWITSMLPTSRKNHTDAIKRRCATVETITESLYKSSFAPEGSACYLPEQMDTAAVNSTLGHLFA